MRYPDWWLEVVDQVRSYHLANPANLPGAAFAVQTLADGPLISSVGDSWSTDTICDIGSMTKPFAATGVLIALEEHDLLDIERPVCQLPGMDAYGLDALKQQ